MIERHDYAREFEFTIRKDPDWEDVAALLDYSFGPASVKP
jgi:hypothetical protein